MLELLPLPYCCNQSTISAVMFVDSRLLYFASVGITQ